jgi:hypothetical protein
MTLRPPVEADLPALQALDAAYATLHGLEPAVTEGSLRFFGRTEHSFVAEASAGAGTNLAGFVLAQAVWSGERPQVLVARLVAGAPEASEPLVKALVKSAYDSGVYDLLTRVPATDAALLELLGRESFVADRMVGLVRILGSRGARIDEPTPAASREEARSHG